MSTFFSQSYYFWFSTRVLFLLAGFISSLSLLFSGELDGSEVLANLAALFYLVAMAIGTYAEFSSLNQPVALRKGVAIFSWILALLLIGLALFYSVKSVPVALLFSLWLIGLGLQDWIAFQRKRVEE